MSMVMSWHRSLSGRCWWLAGAGDGETRKLGAVWQVASGWRWRVYKASGEFWASGGAPTLRHAMLDVELFYEEDGALLVRSCTLPNEHRLTAETILLGVLVGGRQSFILDRERAWRDLAELNEIFRRCGYEAGRVFLARHDTLRSWVPEN